MQFIKNTQNKELQDEFQEIKHENLGILSEKVQKNLCRENTSLNDVDILYIYDRDVATQEEIL